MFETCRPPLEAKVGATEKGVIAMLSMLMLLVLVVVVAGAATAVTIAVMNTRNPRPPLPPAKGSGASGQLQNPQNFQNPYNPDPQFPVYDPTHYLSPGDRERILVLVRNDKKIHAIKLYREVTGSGLREAKAAVEHLERFR